MSAVVRKRRETTYADPCSCGCGALLLPDTSQWAGRFGAINVAFASEACFLRFLDARKVVRAATYCVHCGQLVETCTCEDVAPAAHCYSCSVHTPGWVVGMRDGAPVHIACLGCNADRSKPLLTSNETFAP